MNHYAIGVDGGATKTSMVLIDREGIVHAETICSGTNPTVSEPSIIKTVLRDGKRNLFRKAGLCESTEPRFSLFCMAGPPTKWDEIARELDGFGSVKVAGDHEPLLALVPLGKAVLITHSGTGSFVATRDSRGVDQVHGGYGAFLSDPGSAIDIGKQAFRRFIDEKQASRHPSAFLSAIELFYQDRSISDPFSEIFSSPAGLYQLGCLCPLIVRMALSGDRAAEEILRQSFGSLISLVKEILSYQKDYLLDVHCAFSGKILCEKGIRTMFLEICRETGIAEDWHYIDKLPSEGVIRLLRIENEKWG